MVTVLVAVSFDVLYSPPPATVTVAVSDWVVVVAPTCTLMVIGGYVVSGCATSNRVQTSLCPAVLHVQPVPLAEVGVSCTAVVGKAIVTLTTPVLTMPAVDAMVPEVELVQVKCWESVTVATVQLPSIAVPVPLRATTWPTTRVWLWLVTTVIVEPARLAEIVAALP